MERITVTIGEEQKRFRVTKTATVQGVLKALQKEVSAKFYICEWFGLHFCEGAE